MGLPIARSHEFPKRFKVAEVCEVGWLNLQVEKHSKFILSGIDPPQFHVSLDRKYIDLM
jgi:hypothetical protein